MDRRRPGFGNQPFTAAGREIKRQLRRQRRARQGEAALRGRRPAPAAEPAGAATPEAPDDPLRRELLGVRPLAPGNYVPRGGSARPRLRARDEDAEAMAQLADLVHGRASFDIADSDEYVEGIAQGLDRALLKRLRKGHYAVQSHLDLHGLTRVEAREEVARYLRECRQRRLRCVLIVHGRGLNSADQIPVLKERLKVWLSRGGISQAVLAFCTARPVDGGAGAVYVRLRR